MDYKKYEVLCQYCIDNKYNVADLFLVVAMSLISTGKNAETMIVPGVGEDENKVFILKFYKRSKIWQKILEFIKSWTVFKL